MKIVNGERAVQLNAIVRNNSYVFVEARDTVFAEYRSNVGFRAVLQSFQTSETIVEFLHSVTLCFMLLEYKARKRMSASCVESIPMRRAEEAMIKNLFLLSGNHKPSFDLFHHLMP